MATKPTSIGAKPADLASSLVPASAASLPAVIPARFPVKLAADEIARVEDALGKADFVGMPLKDIATLCADTEQALSRVLDQFLSKVDPADNPKLFALFGKLSRGVEDQKLPEISDKILNGKPDFFWDGARMMVSSRKGRQKIMGDFWERTRQVASGKTRTLTDLVNGMERELQVELRKLETEVTSMEALKGAYRDGFRGYAVSAAFLAALFEDSKRVVAEKEASADLSDPLQKTEIDELKSKLQALESRALSVEGTMTRLPADHVVLQQIQEAAIATLQETITTSGQRFASIKMTLLSLNGALRVKAVQDAAAQGASLDAQLQSVRAKVTKQIATNAANAPGDNRVAQAEQILKIVEDSKELLAIRDQARVDNAAKFASARTMFEKARDELRQIPSGTGRGS